MPVTPLTDAFVQIFVPIAGHNYFQVGCIHINNVTTNVQTIRLCMVSSTDTPSISNSLLWDFSLEANNFIEFGEGKILLTDHSYYAMCGLNYACNIKISGHIIYH